MRSTKVSLSVSILYAVFLAWFLWCFYFISLALGEILKVSKLEQQKKKKPSSRAWKKKSWVPTAKLAQVSRNRSAALPDNQPAPYTISPLATSIWHAWDKWQTINSSTIIIMHAYLSHSPQPNMSMSSFHHHHPPSPAYKYSVTPAHNLHSS
jgi:hypothetical protein